MSNQEAIALLRNLEDSLDSYCELNEEGKTAFRMAIESLELFGNSEQLPSADVQPVVHGEWVDYTEDGYVECPFCHSATNCDGDKDELHFCFSCGAKMDKRKGADCTDCIKNGGDWECDHIHCHKGVG